MVDIKGLPFEELTQYISHLGKERFRAAQIMKWIFQKRAESFDEMTNLAKDFRELLRQSAFISHLEPLRIETSSDGTRKYLFRLTDDNAIESVLIPDDERLTLCVSSQVGCPLACGFCVTGKTGFIRNLTASEIVNQICAVQNGLPDETRITNIVFMGMGEPLMNYENLIRALKIITYGDGLNISSRKITVSTAGIIPEMMKLGSIMKVNLAISLNAASETVRGSIMPVNNKYPLGRLLSACREYPLPPRRRITFEYVMLRGVNDSPADARRLATLLRGIPCKINLIALNGGAETEFTCPSLGEIQDFQNVLIHEGYTTLLRGSKGADINAACGQLRRTYMTGV